jgi:hypothetical protein
MRINSTKFRLFYEEKKIFSFAKSEIIIKIVDSYLPCFKRSVVCFNVSRNIILKAGNAIPYRSKIKININIELK